MVDKTMRKSTRMPPMKKARAAIKRREREIRQNQNKNREPKFNVAGLSNVEPEESKHNKPIWFGSTSASAMLLDTTRLTLWLPLAEMANL